MNDVGGVTISPAGKPNLRVDHVPPRDSMPGSGGMFLAPDRIAIKQAAPESAEAWKADDDARKLAQASSGDSKRLAKEADRLAHAERSVEAAEGSHERARAAVVEMRVYGRPSAKAETNLAKAEAALAKARRDLSITQDVHTAVRGQIIEQVRQDLGATARAKLAQAHQLYDDALARLGQTSALLDAMRTARQAEAMAAQELASALAVVPGLVNGKRGESATGSAYRSIPTDDLDNVALIVDQRPDPIRLEGGAVAGVLGRRADASRE